MLLLLAFISSLCSCLYSFIDHFRSKRLVHPMVIILLWWFGGLGAADGVRNDVLFIHFLFFNLYIKNYDIFAGIPSNIPLILFPLLKIPENFPLPLEDAGAMVMSVPATKSPAPELIIPWCRWWVRVYLIRSEPYFQPGSGPIFRI